MPPQSTMAYSTAVREKNVIDQEALQPIFKRPWTLQWPAQDEGPKYRTVRGVLSCRTIQTAPVGFGVTIRNGDIDGKPVTAGSSKQPFEASRHSWPFSNLGEMIQSTPYNHDVGRVSCMGNIPYEIRARGRNTALGLGPGSWYRLPSALIAGS